MKLHLELIEQTLRVERLETSSIPEWLEESWLNPEAFWHALADVRDAVSPWKGKSRPFQSYDFYHDIVYRNQWNTAPAIRWYDSYSGWHEMAYARLGQSAAKTAEFWKESGVRQGLSLCLISQTGPEFMVSLLAGLKLGAILSFLPPLGNQYLQRRLESLGPDFIAAGQMYAAHLPAWRDRILPEIEKSRPAEGDIEQSHSYASSETVMRCFDPASETPHIPVELAADTVYLNALRDGMIGLGLKPGGTLAAPGFHFLESQPSLSLASLLNGGTFLHIDPDDIAVKPGLLVEYPVRAMGITADLRDTLLEKPIDAGNSWSFWFKNPGESSSAWDHLVVKLKLENVHSVNLKWNAARGGCVLFSIRRKGQSHYSVLPSAGVPWHLAGASGNGAETLGDVGRFAISAAGLESEPAVLPILLAESDEGWMFLESAVSGRRGRYYPRKEVLETIGDMPFESSIDEYTLFRSGLDPLFILLIFTGGEIDVDEAGVIKTVRKAITEEMGAEFLPDEIRFYPLFARHTPEGDVDHEWCGFQFRTGRLAGKSKDAINRSLVRLRKHIYETGIDS